MDKKTRRKSIQHALRGSIKNDLKETLAKINPKFLEPQFSEDKKSGPHMSFMIEDHKNDPNIHSITNFIDKRLENEGLNTTIAFMSSEDEADHQEIKGFAQQINSEFLRKDMYEIWKDFNEISVLLFSKNLKDSVNEYRENSKKFMEEHFRSENLKNEKINRTETGLTNMSNRILSESIYLDSPHLKRFSTMKKPGKETQLNLKLAKMYRQQHNNKKDNLIGYIFWGFVVSSVLILILFFLLFYFNVFSTTV